MVLYPTTPMAYVSSLSRVAATSKIDFTPAQTTVIFNWESEVKSADSSNDSFAPRCTPPKPPVAKTFMPALAAKWAVAATVVAADKPLASAIAKSLVEALITSSRLAIAINCSSVKPICATPSISAIVAGIAPLSRTIDSTSLATSRFVGRGKPWLMMVDSNATTGAPF